MNNSGSEDLSDEDDEENIWSDAPYVIPSDPDADSDGSNFQLDDMDGENVVSPVTLYPSVSLTRETASTCVILGDNTGCNTCICNKLKYPIRSGFVQ